MSQENVEIVRELWEAWMTRGLTDLSAVDPEVTYEDDALPDHIGESYRRHEGIRRAWDRFTEPWEKFENEIEWTRHAGNEVVSAHLVRARGQGSGIEVEFRYAYVWRFRAGKIFHIRSYVESAEALEEVGLRE